MPVMASKTWRAASESLQMVLFLMHMFFLQQPKAFTRFLFETLLLTSGFKLDEKTQFDCTKLKSMTKKASTSNGDKRKFVEFKVKFASFTKLVKEDLGDKTETAIVSARLADSLCVSITSEYAWSVNIERIMKVQAGDVIPNAEKRSKFL